MNDKQQFAAIVISVVAILQGIAWIVGINGAVWAFTSLVIGLVAGSILGFTVNVKKEVAKAVEPKNKD